MFMRLFVVYVDMCNIRIWADISVYGRRCNTSFLLNVSLCTKHKGTVSVFKETFPPKNGTVIIVMSISCHICFGCNRMESKDSQCHHSDVIL